MAANPPPPAEPSARIPVEAIPDPNLPPEPDDDAAVKSVLETTLYHREVIRGLGQDIDERKKYAHRTFCLISTWLVAVYILILLEGFAGLPRSWFNLDKTVLLTVVGSTTASVLGIFIVVMHYLFPTKGQDEK
jgi:uncharacterized membrane protein YhdT